MEHNYLEHYGTKGMRWGVRRYQNKDGTMTAAGKKRYNRELAKVKQAEKTLKNKQKTQAKLDDLERRKQAIKDQKKAEKAEAKAKKADSKPKTKRVEDMTDEELKQAVDRLRLEQNYRDLSPATVDRGKKFAKTVGNDIITPGVKDVGKQMFKSVATYTGNKALDRIAEALGMDDDERSRYDIYTNNKKKN